MYDREGLLAWLDQRDGFQDTRDCQPCSDYLRFYHLPRAEHRAARLVTPQGRVFVQCFSPAVATGSAVYVHGFYDHGGMQWKTVARLLER
ncbi:MAG: hypothetical protein KDI36_16820, partial [Pseudomonadales bacterium]|nr:hypothetical protein [Pseudomonadales bacterium]